MKPIFFIPLIFGLSSCMPWGMMGTGHGHHGDGSHMMTRGSVLEKEVTAGEVKAVGIFPNLEYRKDVTLSLKLMDAKTSSPISDAQVYFDVQYLDQVGRNNHNQPLQHSRQSVAESRLSGTYSIPYGTVKPGEYRLIFHVTAIGERQLEPEIVIETTKVLSSESQQHHGSMMYGTGASAAMMIGSVIMMAMMIAMLMKLAGML